MKTVSDLKPAFQGLLRPLVGVLAQQGGDGEPGDGAACSLSIATGMLVAWLGAAHSRVLLLLLLVLLVCMALNAIDGLLAREHGIKSALGAYLNELGDVVSDAAL